MLLTADVSMVIVGALCLLPPGLGEGEGEGDERFGSAIVECDNRRFQEIGRVRCCLRRCTARGAEPWRRVCS